MESCGKLNKLLRKQRELRGWSQARVAELLQELGGVADSKLVGKWERGVVRPSPFYRERLCRIYGVTADQLGLLPDAPPDEREGVQKERNIDLFQPLAHTVISEFMQLENEGMNMDRSRRSFLQLLGGMGVSFTVPMPLLLAPSAASIDITNETIESIATITQSYRTLQKAGLTIESNLKNHISLIQTTLENTCSEGHRRELWRNLSLTQLLARHNITKKAECMQARTWNEAAIASAQYSGDTLLLGAALGHLGHLYFRWLDDPEGARQLVDQAQIYTKKHAVSGWLAMIAASIAAQGGQQKQCEASIDRALETAHSLPENSACSDLYYMDFNAVGTEAFAGNCFLKMKKPAKALEYLLTLNFETFSRNRHASAFCDTACAYVLAGELEEAKVYAIRSVDTAIATNRIYIIDRLINFFQIAQQKYPHTDSTSFILEYAQHALVTEGVIA